MKVLITDHVHDLLIDGLAQLGYDCTYMPDLDPGDFLPLAKAFQGIIHNSKIKFPKTTLQELPNMLFIGRLGSGLEIIDLQEAAQRGIAVFSAPEGNCQAVAEHALGMLLALLNHLPAADANVRAEKWDREPHRGRELKGLTVGLVGFGHTGQALARLLQGFGCRLLVCDPISPDLTDFPLAEKATMDEISAQADVVSIHVSYDPSLHHWINRSWINRFSKPFYLINTARGMVVNLEDLIAGIKTGRVLGACLDVLENEKPTTFSRLERIQYRTLHQLPQVILSPHIAGWTIESKRKIAQVLLAKITAWQQSDQQT
ncbi:MAG: hydroxyacid dehydrogenase [Saprospiraceae bacterium]|nr:hydroxyacid dehydrogenase [Saprospiraceae bacterium]